jgi:hypothetical protein
MINRIRLSYGVKRFFLFLLFAIPACNLPFYLFGMALGFPAVVLTATFIAVHDSLTTDINHMPAVFSQKIAALWIVEIMTVVLLINSGSL